VECLAAGVLSETDSVGPSWTYSTIEADLMFYSTRLTSVAQSPDTQDQQLADVLVFIVHHSSMAWHGMTDSLPNVVTICQYLTLCRLCRTISVIS